jgi:hypothetical protein
MTKTKAAKGTRWQAKTVRPRTKANRGGRGRRRAVASGEKIPF